MIRQRRIPFEIVADELEYVPNEETAAVLRRVENDEEMLNLSLDELVAIAKVDNKNA